jgi:hypothetical protein
MQAEKLLIGEGIRHTVIPTPKEYSSDCGLSLRLDPKEADMNKVLSVLNENGVFCKVYDKEYL